VLLEYCEAERGRDRSTKIAAQKRLGARIDRLNV
jgi:hypothetical protein